jgi:hypothetical protein
VPSRKQTVDLIETRVARVSEPRAVRHRAMRNARPLTRRGSLNRQPASGRVNGGEGKRPPLLAKLKRRCRHLPHFATRSHGCLSCHLPRRPVPSYQHRHRTHVSSAAANQPFVFTPSLAPGGEVGSDPLVNQTRREIAEIVREIATAAGSDRTTDEFLTLLVDRVLRAMAAEGVIVWQQSESEDQAFSDFSCVKRLGRVTDQSIPDESAAAHGRMLLEVAAHGQPVVVPPTPGSTDHQTPANPMEVAVALVPIECEPTADAAEFLLEVFLEPDCGVATQRGYLRFVAQMADLAGEFLRSDQLRRLRHKRALAAAVDRAIDQLHTAADVPSLDAATVDGAAELFGFDRVGLCLLYPRVTLTAVSHVNTIDAKSPAAEQLREAAKHDLDNDTCVWIDADNGSVPGTSLNDSLALRAVVGSGMHRLVCMQVVDIEPIPDEIRYELVRYTRHADLARNSLMRLAAIPGGRFLASLAPAITYPNRRLRRTVATIVAAAILLMIAAVFPVPLVVYSPASIRPANVQIVTAPRDAVVAEIHVRHGQPISAGEKLLTLADPILEERITSLVGRRAVLVQKQSHWTEVMVDTASHRLERMEQVQGERSLVGEEIQSINDQLAVLERVTQSLTIRADRSGFVDAWRIEQRLQSRPLRRGDHLVRVIAGDSDWLADVRVPQSRISHVQDARAEQQLVARILLESNPNQSIDAKLLQIGPSLVADAGEVPSTAVLLQLRDEASGAIVSAQEAGHPSGTPARVMFRCGTAPIAYLLFQDVIRSLRSNFSLYLTSHSEDTGEMQ